MFLRASGWGLLLHCGEASGCDSISWWSQSCDKTWKKMEVHNDVWCIINCSINTGDHTTEPNCTQPSIAQHTTGQVADKVAVRECVDSALKQADFVHLNVSQGQSLSKHCFQWCWDTHWATLITAANIRRLKARFVNTLDCQNKYAWLCATRARLCAGPCLGRVYARLCAQCATNLQVGTAINQEHGIVLNNSTEFVFNEWS